MNRAYRRAKQTLEVMGASNKDHVHGLITNATTLWETNLDKLNPTNKYLLDYCSYRLRNGLVYEWHHATSLC